MAKKETKTTTKKTNLVTKTVLEWLGELKLLNKKIEKTEKSLISQRAYDVNFKEQAELYKEHIKEKSSKFVSEYESLKSLYENKDKIRQAIIEYNATTYINIDGKEYSMALALEKTKNNNNFLIKVLTQNKNYLSEDVATKENLRENKKVELQKIITAKTNSSSVKDEEALNKAMENYKVITQEFIEIEKELTRLSEEEINFSEKAIIAINMKNATTNIEIDYNN